MDVKQILSRVDHTLLQQTATWNDIKEILDDAIEFSVASACIPPCFVKQAKDYVGDKLAVCTVIGFPNGYNASSIKVWEAYDAVRNGADEIDMVINIGMVKDGNYKAVLDEIKAVRGASEGKILKVIVETCFLTEEEKIKMCEIVTEGGADFIKTSTGFGGGGATLEDVVLLKKHVGQGVSVKASGGISSLEDAQRFIEAGASRLGTSRLILLAKKSLAE